MTYRGLDEVSMAHVLEDIADERERQVEKFGDQSHHPDGTGHAFRQWRADNARVTCDMAFRQGAGTWALILEEEFCKAMAESDPARLREELVQVAAVATAWVEAIDGRDS